MTKTETLVDVLPDLCEFAPERFEWTAAGCKMALGGHYFYSSYAQNQPLIRVAVMCVCMEEIETRRWELILSYDAEHCQWEAIIQRWSDHTEEPEELAYFDSPYPSDAVATALRDALKIFT